jgi:energy-coupling factor transporter ATP-binding protein EcfA2
MLTKLIVRNFKRFEDVEIELGNPVVFIGPNNLGKTTALQALALWEIGVRRWFERRVGRGRQPEKRPGVTINRRDLLAVPVPNANLLWRDLHVRSVSRVKGKPFTQNIRIEVVVEGISAGKPWTCGLEFDYANEESFYCRPLHARERDTALRMPVPEAAGKVRVAFLPPMSGLASQEISLDPGTINVRIGEGRTADVLRNLCYQILNPTNSEKTEKSPDHRQARWKKLSDHILSLFGVELNPPEYIAERGEIVMSYRDKDVTLDLSASGRGLQQTLLLLAYIYANPGAVLLLDEPDAHLEFLRQRQIYELITQEAISQGSQVIAATHSEVVLNEAAGRDLVIAFVGEPHRLIDRGSQVLKSLTTLGFEQYYQAENKKWVLYLEGSTDLAILQAFAKAIDHPSSGFLERPFVCYVANQPAKAREHFYGLREAVPGLRGVALFDRLEVPVQAQGELLELMWQRREIENYLCMPSVLRAFARADLPEDLFGRAEAERREKLMDQIVRHLVPPVAWEDPNDTWWVNVKASDEFLDRVFREYFAKLGLPNLLDKTTYYKLAEFVPSNLVTDEVISKLDKIAETGAAAEPKPGLPPPAA